MLTLMMLSIHLCNPLMFEHFSNTSMFYLLLCRVFKGCSSYLTLIIRFEFLTSLSLQSAFQFAHLFMLTPISVGLFI